MREIWEVTETWAADMYKGLARRLNALFVGALPGFPHPSAHGYVAGRSTWTNALRTSVGVASFARTSGPSSGPSPTSAFDNDVRAELNDEAAAALSRILSWNDHVPLGLHTSPIVANAVP
ncbi:MAG: hypothetical protein U0168_09020 [Nannocystaceae bacterium]